MMKRALLIGMLAALGAGAARAETPDLPTVGEVAETTIFAQSIEDLPVMKGLELAEDKDALFVFGAERIMQATLKGRVDIDSVYYFYADALPAAGWTKINMRLYERAGERLRLDASSANEEGMTYVRFEIEPAGGKQEN